MHTSNWLYYDLGHSSMMEGLKSQPLVQFILGLNVILHVTSRLEKDAFFNKFSYYSLFKAQCLMPRRKHIFYGARDQKSPSLASFYLKIFCSILAYCLEQKLSLLGVILLT